MDIAGDNVPVVLVRMKAAPAAAPNSSSATSSAESAPLNSVTFAVPAGSVYQWYAVNVAANTNWTGHTIKALRLDPPNSTGTVSIDAIIGSSGDFNDNGIPTPWEVANQLDPTTAANPQLDTDSDSSPDLLEYATAMNPSISDAVPISATTTATTLDFFYRKKESRHRPDLHRRMERHAWQRLEQRWRQRPDDPKRQWHHSTNRTY